MNNPPSDAVPPPDPKLSGFAGPLDSLIRSGVVLAPSSPGILGRIEHYDLLKQVGGGGMGYVYLARNTRNGDKVALKLLRPELATHPQARQLFLREVRLMRKSVHPHIVPILDSHESPERVWFVMPYFEAGSLAQRLAAGKPLAPESAIRMVRQVAQALQFAHDKKGTIHRDLKPANILLDAQGNAALTDFGLGREFSGDSILGQIEQQCVGTAAYMSPAAAEGNTEDTRGDIYGLGTVLYEMLAGRPPYAGTTREILSQVRNGPPRPLTEVNPKCPPPLATVVEHAMARNLRDRYASMGDLIADLDRVADGRPPFGPHGQGETRSTPPMRVAPPRRKLAWAVAAVVPLAALGLLWLAGRPRLKVANDLHLPGSPQWVSLADWDGDGPPEILTVGGKAYSIVSREGIEVQHREVSPASAPGLPPDHGFNTNTALTPAGVMDVNGDGSDDLLLRWEEDREQITNDLRVCVAHAAALNIKNHLFLGHYAATGISRLKEKEWHSSTLRPECITHLAGAATPDLIVSLCAGYGRRPRGITCFDPTGTTTMRWTPFVESAGQPLAPAFADTDRDGRVDLVFVGSAASCNTNDLADGTRDDQAVLHAISAEGCLRWKTNLASRYAGVSAVVVRSNTTTFVCAVVTRRHGYRQDDVLDSPELPELGQLFLFNTKGVMLTNRDVGVDLRPPLVADLDRDGCEEVLVGDRLGRLHVFDAGLRPKAILRVVDPLPFSGLEITNLVSLAGRLKAASDPLSAYLVRGFSSSSRKALEANPGPSVSSNELQQVLLKELNSVIGGPLIYDTNRFRGGELRPSTSSLLAAKPRGVELMQLNRLLLEDAYRREFSRSRWINLEPIALAHLRKSNEPLLVVVSTHVWANYDLGFASTTNQIVRPEPHTHPTVHLFTTHLRPVATLEIDETLRGHSPTFTLADWDGDGLQEIVALEPQRVRVLKLK